MPARTINYADDKKAIVYVRVPGWLKNLIKEVAKSRGKTQNDWAATVLKHAAESGAGMPEPIPARVPIPLPEDVLRSYLAGKEVLEPCGKPYPCEMRQAGTHDVGGYRYCNACRIRVG
jgi:hypothetical protein